MKSHLEFGSERTPHSLQKLPYPMKALEPFISENTLNFHYGKHHQAYVDNLNKLISGSALEKETLEDVIINTYGDSKKVSIFNNAGQVWNHTFYWHCMKPGGGGMPKGELFKKIEEDFGNFESFKEQFKQAGIGQFGSGWAWLVFENGKLKVTKTSNAELPLVYNQHPIITMDVWEHAYYLDYQNRRIDYVSIFLEKIINWEFAENIFLQLT